MATSMSATMFYLTHWLEPVSIEELINDGYLAPLRSKLTAVKLNTDGVHRRGGEFIERATSCSQQAWSLIMALYLRSLSAVRIANHGCFCTGIEHAQAITDELRQHDITAECVTGDTPQGTTRRYLKAV